MSLLENWVQTPGAMALVWTLLHSLWEGAAVALLLGAALCVIRGSRGRYTAACLALFVMLAGFGLTFATLMMREQKARAAAPQPAPVRLAPIDLDAGDTPRTRTPRSAADYLPWAGPFWIAGVFLFHLRSLAGWMGAHRLRRTGVCCAPAVWQRRLDRLAARLRISGPVTLFESCLADVPLVIGFLRPVILMPVGLLAGLPAAQIEALLLHELAHIRRYDYLVNLLQVFAEGLVFYHPAVWWMAAVIRAEREHCCDDLVVTTQGDAFQYATALAALEYNRGDARQPALAATGGSLVKRIRRLLHQPETPRSALTPVLSAAILTVTAVAVLAAWQTKTVALPSLPAPAVVPLPVPAAVPSPIRAPLPRRLIAQAQRTPVAFMAESPYSKWLKEDVVYIIDDVERAAFLRLQTDTEREHFIEQFWLRRDPTPGTPANEFKEEHYRRIAYANGNFATAVAGWKSDRGQIYIKYGPPDEKESHPSGGQYRRPPQGGGGAMTTFPFEQWRYRFIEGAGKDIVFEFVDPTMTGEYSWTFDPAKKDAMLHVPGADFKQAAAVRVLDGSALISFPLGAYQDHRVSISARIFTRENALVHTIEEVVQGPALEFSRTVPLGVGLYRLVLSVRDLTNGITINDTSEFSVK